MRSINASAETVLGAHAASPEKLDATYCLYTWNQERYVEQAVRSALGQTNCTLDLIISDDASTDGTWGRILAAVDGYQGPHRVRLNRNARNLGIDHFPALVRVAGKEIIFHAHGDDVAEPDRVEVTLRAFAGTGASVVSSNALRIDARGRRIARISKDTEDRAFSAEDLLVKLWRPQMVGALLAIRREVYERFPWLDSQQLARGHDSLVPWRGALLGGFHWIARPLLQRRRHEGQWSKRLWGEPGREALKESKLAQFLSVGRARRRDLDHLLADAGELDRARLMAIRVALDARMTPINDRWLDVRESLVRQGRRPHWSIDQAKRPPDQGKATPWQRIKRAFRRR